MEKLRLDSAKRMEKIRSDERVALENSTVQPGNYFKCFEFIHPFPSHFPLHFPYLINDFHFYLWM
jgi:hypothetical protein